MHFKQDNRYQGAIAVFDALNAQDTNTVYVDGKPMPKELHDALAMTRWVEALYPHASEAVHLAARCQHLCRWELPRNRYPAGRAGYHQWRTELKQRHASKSAEVLRAQAYEPSMIEAVRAINLKQGLKTNPDVQQIEDALCLVFLENQFEGYLDQWDEDKIIRILQKAWVKMSECGHEAALRIKFSDRALELLQRALAG